MNSDLGILIVVTEKFNAMKQLFVDLGLEVKEEGCRQVTPMFNNGRGCMVLLKSALISIEESTDVPPSGPLYLQIEGIDESRLISLKGRYPVKHVQGGLYGCNFYAIKSPCGGLIHAVPA